jgi:hypothetical protein
VSSESIVHSQWEGISEARAARILEGNAQIYFCRTKIFFAHFTNLTFIHTDRPVPKADEEREQTESTQKSDQRQKGKRSVGGPPPQEDQEL